MATKRIATRGRKLERKESDLEYGNFENIVFACYWCNNAKTDTFSEGMHQILEAPIKSSNHQRLAHPLN